MAKVGFTGHQGLTADTTIAVRREIVEFLKGKSDLTGLCSLAEGSDQIFAEAVIEVGGSLVAIIPCQGYDETFEDSRSFKALLAKCDQVIQLPFEEPSEAAFWAAGQRVVNESGEVLAVWDGLPSKGLGGTADVVNLAKTVNKKVRIIWPEGSRRS
jgi:hypothetical protein